MMVVTAGTMFAVFVVMVVTAGACFAMFVVMVVTAGTRFTVFVMVVVTAGTRFAVFVVMVVLMMSLHSFSEELFFHCALLKCIENLSIVQLVQMCCDDIGILIDFTDNFNSLCNFCFVCLVCACEKDAVGIKNLIFIEFAEVLYIHLCLCAVNNCDARIDSDVFVACIVDRCNNVRKLADARWFDDNAVRVISFNSFLESLCEVAYQCAADAAGIHFCNFNACVLQKAAVNADFAEFIFDEDKLFALENISDKTLYKCCLAGAEKAGNYIYLCHITDLFS